MCLFFFSGIEQFDYAVPQCNFPYDFVPGVHRSVGLHLLNSPSPKADDSPNLMANAKLLLIRSPTPLFTRFHIVI